jgi:hypothetical protein
MFSLLLLALSAGALAQPASNTLATAARMIDFIKSPLSVAQPAAPVSGRYR